MSDPQLTMFDEPDAPPNADPGAHGLRISLDTSFASATRMQLDATSWIDHVPGWLTGDGDLIDLLREVAPWEQRSRWMYTRQVQEPRLTAEFPVIDDAPHPVFRYLADALGTHYRSPFTRLWMNWYRDHQDGTGWHADRPANRLPSVTIPVLSLGATRRFLVRPAAGGRSIPFTVHGGDLIVMGGRCQRDYQHMVPKQKTGAAGRMSLNFSAPISADTVSPPST